MSSLVARRRTRALAVALCALLAVQGLAVVAHERGLERDLSASLTSALEGAGSVGGFTGQVWYYDVNAEPTSWVMELTVGGSFVVDDPSSEALINSYESPFRVYISGESPSETFLEGEGTVTVSLDRISPWPSIDGEATGTYTRTGSHLEMEVAGDAAFCALTSGCASGSFELSMVAEFYGFPLVGFCTWGCSTSGAFLSGDVRSPTMNQPPNAPTLVSPPDGKVFAEGEIPTFTIEATDPDGDAYIGEVRIYDEDGHFVRSVSTGPAPSGSKSSGSSLSFVLPRGRYTWTARAHDAYFTAGPTSSSSRAFEVTAPLVDDPVDAVWPRRPEPRTTRASVDTKRHQANGASGRNSMSDDGRFVSFESEASDLVPGDTNGVVDVFVKDRASGSTTRVSLSSGGAQGSRDSGEPSMSADGRYVAFSSYADNLVSGDTNGAADIFVHDRVTEVTQRVSLTSSGGQANGTSGQPSMSADGRYVAFSSYADNLVSGDTNGWPDVFVHDRVTGKTERVSVSSSETQGNHISEYPSISADGRYVAFSSYADNLLSSQTYWSYVYVRDRANGTTSLVSVTDSGEWADSHAWEPSISSDGRYVAFHSLSKNLAGETWDGDPGSLFDRVFRYDIQASEIALVGSGDQASISPDGDHVAWRTGSSQIAVENMADGEAVLVSQNDNGTRGNRTSHYPSVSRDGVFVSFQSYSTNLVIDDDNDSPDAFLRQTVEHPNPCEDHVVSVATPLGCAGPRRDVPYSDTVGLEDFYAYEPFDLGASSNAYVNVGTGNLVVQGRDFEIPGQGLNLRLTRTYNTARDDQDGPLGRGWSIGVHEGEAETDLIETVQALLYSNDLGQVAELLGHDDQFDFVDADGTHHHFVKDEGQWRSPPGVDLTLVDSVDERGYRIYTLVRPDGVSYDFRAIGTDYYLTKVADRAGNELGFSYTEGKLQTVTDPRGRTLSFTWSGDYLSEVVYTSGGQSVETAYTVDPTTKRLTSVTEAVGTTDERTISYSYGSDALTTVVDARGNPTGFVYDDQRRLTTLTDRNGQAWSLTYGGDSCEPVVGTSTVATCLTEPDGATQVFTVSQDGNLVHHRDAGDADTEGNPRPNDRRFSWTEHRLVREVDEAGNVTEYGYNDVGLITEVRRHIGSGDDPATIRLTYDRPSLAVADLAKVTAGVGSSDERVWSFDHDSLGNLTRSTDPLGNPTTFTYHPGGLLASVSDANGNTTTYGDPAVSGFGYHPSGQPEQITDPTGKSVTVDYDFLGNPTSITDRTGSTTSFAYDLHGNRTSETDPLGHQTLHCYDANDNEVLTVRPKAATKSCSLTGADPHVIERSYYATDLLAKVLTTSDGQYRKWHYKYETDGALEKILEPRSFSTSDTSFDPVADPQVATYLRYPNDRLRAFVDEEGARTDFVYTPDGNLRRVTFPSAGAPQRHQVTYTYNRFDQVKTDLRSGHSAPTTHTYNVHGERIRTTNPKGNATLFAYDKAGRLAETTDATGATATYSYDPAGNLLGLHQPAGNGAHLTTKYTYTGRGEIASETDPADPNHVIEYAYDGEGRQRFRHDRYNGSIERTTETRYDAAGRLTERISSFAGTSSGKHRAVFAYDPHGNRTAVDTYLDGATSPNLSEIDITYTSADEIETWTETLHGPSGPVTKTSAYGYLPDGLLASRTVDSKTTTYQYLRNGRETTTDPWGGSAVTSRWHPSGDLETRHLPNGTTLTQSFDLAGRLDARVFTQGSAKVSAWEAISYDDNDNRRSEVITQTQPDGTTKSGKGVYDYDALDRLTLVDHALEPVAANRKYDYDDAGNVLDDLQYTYQYDANRLTKRALAPLGQPHFTYTYDHFGNQTEETLHDAGSTQSTTTSYDAASHTRRVTAPDGTTLDYAYDGLDRLVRRTENGSTDLLFHDRGSDLLALETDASGTATTRYVLASTGEPLAQDTAKGRGYYVTDPRGNLTQLLDGSGDVVAVYGYDAFGGSRDALTHQNAGWDSRLRFQTAPEDKTTGAYALGPRMYDPEINRFVGADHYVGSAANLALQLDPLTGNRYMYAGSNPVNLIDDGHAPLRWGSWSTPHAPSGYRLSLTRFITRRYVSVERYARYDDSGNKVGYFHAETINLVSTPVYELEAASGTRGCPGGSCWDAFNRFMGWLGTGAGYGLECLEIGAVTGLTGPYAAAKFFGKYAPRAAGWWAFAGGCALGGAKEYLSNR